jgi:hypothetical protein
MVFVYRLSQGSHHGSIVQVTTIPLSEIVMPSPHGPAVEIYRLTDLSIDGCQVARLSVLSQQPATWRE